MAIGGLNAAHLPTAESDSSPDRLVFLDILRGLSALVVVIGHYTVLYLTGPDVVAGLTNAEPIAPAVMPDVLAKLWDIFNLPVIGVGVFFLISGFVIPLSLVGTTARAFFIKRLARIYPTYWAALAIGVAALFLSAAYWGKPVTHRWTDYLANAALITEFSGQFDIISVMWTLQVELKFYLLAPLFAWLIMRNATAVFLLWGIAIVALYRLAVAGCAGDIAACWGHYGPVGYVAWEAMYVTFMLIGSVTYAHYSGRISLVSAIVLAAALFGCFVISFQHSHMAPLTGIFVRGYSIALVIFMGCYLVRDRLGLTRWLRFLADVSYPLYVVHPLVGYVCMRLLMANGAPYALALPVAFALAFGLAMAIHRFVEMPSLAFGRRLARRASAKRSDVPAQSGPQGELQEISRRAS